MNFLEAHIFPTVLLVNLIVPVGGIFSVLAMKSILCVISTKIRNVHEIPKQQWKKVEKGRKSNEWLDNPSTWKTSFKWYQIGTVAGHTSTSGAVPPHHKMKDTCGRSLQGSWRVILAGHTLLMMHVPLDRHTLRAQPTPCPYPINVCQDTRTSSRSSI